MARTKKAAHKIPRENSQESTRYLIPKVPFQRLVREILRRYGDFRTQRSTLECLQEASEHFLTSLLEDANMITLHRGRDCITPKDMQLALIFREFLP